MLFNKSKMTEEECRKMCRTLDFHKPEPSMALSLTSFYHMRRNKTCDSGFLDTFIWADYYKVRVAVIEDKALLLLMQDGDEYFGAMPYCAEEDLPTYFLLLQTYFNDVLHKPFKIYLADEEAVESLGLLNAAEYIVKEEVDLRDYIYDGEELRTLPGKKFQKKRNLVHKFEREYEGRWEYRTLRCKDHEEVEAFLKEWFDRRKEEGTDAEDSLEFEEKGLLQVLDDCSRIPYRSGGIFIDGQLKALSVGALNPFENMACISVEKGDSDIPGIYQVINQQFLLHEFADAAYVNREDDLGLEGLRQSKMSYNPVLFERKYMVLQKAEGYREELIDHYEAEIEDYGEAE